MQLKLELIMQNMAIFFDRDDTLIVDKGYMFNPSDLAYFPDTIEVLRSLQKKGYLLFIVTNQSGVGRGYFSIDQMHEFNDFMLADLKSHGVEIKELVFCPHSPEDSCDCRKPSPKLINELCDKYRIDRTKSYMIGDKKSDIEAGENDNIKSILISNKVPLKKILAEITE